MWSGLQWNHRTFFREINRNFRWNDFPLADFKSRWRIAFVVNCVSMDIKFENSPVVTSCKKKLAWGAIVEIKVKISRSAWGEKDAFLCPDRESIYKFIRGDERYKFRPEVKNAYFLGSILDFTGIGNFRCGWRGRRVCKPYSGNCESFDELKAGGIF